jgi:asparagine synthase (glutamine-hydrolysing)
MAHSVELRSPFLDKEIIDFAFNQTPTNQKISLFQRKILLKKLASKILPGQFNLKRKQGLSIPINDLLREEIWFDYFYTKISDFQTPIFNKDLLFKLMNDQKAGMQNGERLFSIVHFICWHNRYINT